MSRWVIAIALTWSAWALQQPAVVQARSLLSSELGSAMCGENSQTVSWEELALGRAVSHPSLTAASADEHAAPLPLRTAAAAEDDAPPAWCISPDDPRCAPRDQSAPLDGPRAHVPMQDVTAMSWPDLAADSGSDKLRPRQLGALRAGVELHLERPPRG